MSYRFGKNHKFNERPLSNELEKVLQPSTPPSAKPEPKKDDDWNPDWDAPIPSFKRTLERLAALERGELPPPPPENVDKEKKEAEIKARRDSLNRSNREQPNRSFNENMSPWGNSSFGQPSPFGGWSSAPSQGPSGWGGPPSQGSATSFGGWGAPPAQGPVTSFGGWGGAPAQGPATSYPGWGGGYSQPSPFGRDNSLGGNSMNQQEQSLYSETNQGYSGVGQDRYETASEADFTDDVFRRAALNQQNTIGREGVLSYGNGGDNNNGNEHIFSNANINSIEDDEVDDGDYDQDEYTDKEDVGGNEFGQGPLSSRPRGPFKSSFKDLYPDNSGGFPYNQNMATMRGNAYTNTFQGYVQNMADVSRYNQNMANMNGAGTFQNSVPENAEGSENSEIMPNMTGAGTDVVAEGVDQTQDQRPRNKLKEEFMKDREELEKMMNAKGDSIYRRGNEPIPAHLEQPPANEPVPAHLAQPPANPSYEGGFGGPEGSMFGLPPKRIMTADEIKAEMALQKIARAAIKAARSRKGRRGKMPVVFI